MRPAVAPSLLAVLALGWAAACAPPSNAGRPCEVDSDCAVGDSCVEGACTFTGRFPIPVPPSDAGAPRDEDAGVPPADDAGAVDGGVTDAGDADAGDAGPADWWDPAWTHREKVRLHAVMISGVLSDVVVSVPLADVIPDDERSVDDVDVRFTDPDGTALPYELESSGASAVAWVRVPEVTTHRSDDYVWLYWQNAAAVDAQDPAAVWQGWEAVLHMDAVVGEVLPDSTGNGHDAAPGDTTLDTGLAGGARRFAGTGGVTLPNLAGDAFPQDRGTIFLSVAVDDRSVASDIFDTPVGTGGQLYIDTTGTGSVRFRAREDGATVLGFATAILPQWTSLSVRWNAAGNLFIPMRDGSEPGNANSWALNTFRPTNQQSVVGATLVGRVDEVRVSARQLSNEERELLSATLDLRVAIPGDTPQPPDVPARTLARVADTTVLYDLDEGSGTLAADDGAAGLGLDLTLDEPTRVEWIQGGAWFRGRALFSRADSPGLTFACAAGDLTVEAWLSSDNTLLGGPARIFTYSESTSVRNFTLGQEQTRFSLRHRTTGTDDNGDSNDLSGTGKPHTTSGSVTPGVPQHVAFVRESEVFTTYVDGVSVQTREWAGDVSGAWDSTQSLGIGNEVDGDRPWLGGVYLLAVYCRALSDAEIEQNYAAGP